MARLKWDGLRTSNGRYEINTVHDGNGNVVEYFFGKCPLLEVDEAGDVVRDEVPRGSADLADMREMAQAIEDGTWRDLAVEQELERRSEVLARRAARQDEQVAGLVDVIVERVVAKLDERAV